MIAKIKKDGGGATLLRRLALPVLIVGFLLWQNWPLNAQGSHNITLSWTAPTTGGAPTTYNVKRGTATGTEVKIATVNVPSTTYSDTNGVAGTTYFYVISASNQFGESPNSNEVSATFLGDKPGAPVGATAVAQ